MRRAIFEKVWNIRNAWHVLTRLIRRKKPVILVWANASPRLMTMIPIVRALRAAGYDAILCFQPKMMREAVTLPILKNVEWLAIPKFVLRHMPNVQMFISAETAISQGPRHAVRVALYHSLPDHALAYNYPAMFRQKPHVVPHIDYFGVSVKQSDKQWNVDNYTPIVDKTMPPSLLEGRRDVLTVFPFGYPKIDLLMKRAATGTLPLPDTLVYAPTQTTMLYSSVHEYGADILGNMLDAFPRYRIVFRPYPGHDPSKLAHISQALSNNPRFHLDTSMTGEEDLIRSAVLVTDRSSMAMSFSLGLARPSVFFSDTGVTGDNPTGFIPFDPVGYRAGSVQGVTDAIHDALRQRETIARTIAHKRGDYLYHPGHAATALVDMVPDMLAGIKHEDWLEILRRPFPSDDKTEIAAHIDRLAENIGSVDQPKGIASLAAIKDGFADQDPGFFGEGLAALRNRLGLRRYRSRPRGHDKE